MSDHDDLLTGLAGLSAEPPTGLLDRIAARWVKVPGPIGDLYVASTGAGVAYVRTADSVDDDTGRFAAQFRDRVARPLLPGTRPPAGVLPALRTGRPGDLRFDLSVVSGFEREVLEATATIPPGQVRPYAWIAREIGNPKAVRAVGTALRRNPVPILIPCHRVVRSDGATGAYVFGADTKVRLLGGEGVDLPGLADLAGHGVHYLAGDTTGVVCLPTCANARRITPAHRHGFRTLGQAERAGYRPCQVCRPGAA